MKGSLRISGGAVFIVLLAVSVSFAGSGARITHRWGEHATAHFTGVTQDAMLIWGGNEDSAYLGIRDSDDKHTLVYFNLSAIPAGTTIFSAKLRLFFEVAYGVADQDKSGYMMDLYRITDPQGRGMWVENQATRTSRRTGVPWTAFGDVFTSLSATPVDRVFSHPKAYGAGADNFWAEWDVTSVAQGWVNGDFPNQGFLLDGRKTLGQDAIAHSSEHPTASTRPYLEITYAGTGTYPVQVSAVQPQYRDGQTFITWEEITGGDPETTYRVYRHTVPITTDNLAASELIDEVPQGSATFTRLAENNGRLSTPFSGAPLPDGTGLYVYTVESSGTHYYAVTSVVRGNENRTVGSGNSAGPVTETVAPVSPVRQFMENPDPLASANRQVFIVWLGRFDPTDRYSDYGYANRRSVPYIFRVTTPEVWNPASSYPLTVCFHYFSDSYFCGGHGVPEPGRFVLAADDHDPAITANLYGHTMWYGYNSNYGTRRPPTEGVVVNYTERRMDWIVDWVMNRSGVFKINPSRVYMKGGSMGGAAQWAYGIRRPNLFVAGETAVPAVNLTYDPNGRHYSLWGYEPSIMTNDGVLVDERVNAGAYATTNPGADFPIMLMFARKGDIDVPWPQYPPFFAALDASRHIGGALYWTQGDHVTGEFPWGVFSEWSSETEYQDWIYQFVRNQSYPAFSRFSLNGNPGKGNPADGDLRGGFNRFPRWDTATIVDTASRWDMTLRLHPGAPVSTSTADVTPRRLQALTHTPGTCYVWENRQQPADTVVQSGTASADATSLITLPSVILTKGGNRIVITTCSAVQPTLTVTKAGTGSGTVTSSPPGITCGTDCTESYPYDTSVTLTATPATGSVFTRWEGDCTGTTSTCTVNMTQTRNVTAVFTRQSPSLTLSVNQSVFHRAERLTLGATVTPGATPVTADVYMAVQLPDGSLLFLQGDGSFTSSLQPIVRSWTISPFTGQIFAYTFGGGEPSGNYAWLAAFTQPGTLTFIGPIVSAPFSFSP